MSGSSIRRQSSYSFSTEWIDTKKVVNEKEDFKNRGRLYGMLFHDWKAIVAVIPSLGLGSIPIVSYFFIGAVFNAHADYLNNTDKAAAMSIIKTNSIYLLIIAIVGSLCRFLTTFLWTRVGSQFVTRLKKNMFTGMMQSDVAFFDTNSIGSLMTLLSEDAQLVQESFGTIKGTQFQNIGTFLIGIIYCFVYSWKIALITLAVIPFIILIISLFSRFIDRHVQIKFIHLSDSMTIAEETLAAIRTVRGFNREKQEYHRFMNKVESTRREDNKIETFVNYMYAIVLVGLYIVIVGNLYYGGLMVHDKIMEAGTLIAIFGSLEFSGLGFIELQASYQGEQKAIASGGRILEFTRRQPDIPFSGGKIIEDFKGSIEFKNVSFKYPSRDVYVLKNVSFIINAGEIGALVGHSGSGKSTCVQLLERFYECSEGFVLIDGIDIKEIDPRWLHSKIALVSQEPSLFQMSIMDNIKYGSRDATYEEVEEAATISNSKKFIMKMENKYDQQVGEKGSTLSGGQRQRIAIARAVIKNPTILITDEATSALDAESEKKVQLSLDKVMVGRTAVVVAHRLSTIKNAHIIYLFDSGEIKEVGTHATLLEKHGYYFELVKRQLTKEEVDQLDDKFNHNDQNNNNNNEEKSQKEDDTGKPINEELDQENYDQDKENIDPSDESKSDQKSSDDLSDI